MSLNLYPDTRTEIDLRSELQQTIDGNAYEIAKGRMYILRRMRRVPGTDERIRCACFNPDTKEGSADVYCPYCHGEGHLWDEEWFKGLNIKNRMARQARLDAIIQEITGQIYPGLSYIYTTYDICPTRHDRVITPQIDVQGNIQWPIKIAAYYYVEKPDHKRCDDGRIEYWRLTVRERLPEGGVYG